MKVSLATEDVVVGSESNSTRCTPRFSSLARIVALGLAGLCAAFAFAQPIGTSNSSDKKADQVRVVLLGTAAGRTFYRGGSDKGISTAIIAVSLIYHSRAESAHYGDVSAEIPDPVPRELLRQWTANERWPFDVTSSRC